MRNWLLMVVVLVAGCGGGGGNVVVEDHSINGEAAAEARATGIDDGYIAGQDLGGNLLAQRVVYFAYDSRELTSEADIIVRAHAKHLLATPELALILEGHTDERGTREYNLALAEGRAVAVAEVLQALGVDAERIQTVSYGEERPVALGHDDAAWSLNRRVEILYQ